MDIETTDKEIAGELSPVEVANIATILAYEKGASSSDADEPIIFTRNGNIYSVYKDSSNQVQLTSTGHNMLSDYIPDKGKFPFTRKSKEADPGGGIMNIDIRTGQ